MTSFANAIFGIVLTIIAITATTLAISIPGLIAGFFAANHSWAAANNPLVSSPRRRWTLLVLSIIALLASLETAGHKHLIFLIPALLAWLTSQYAAFLISATHTAARRYRRNAATASPSINEGLGVGTIKDDPTTINPADAGINYNIDPSIFRHTPAPAPGDTDLNTYSTNHPTAEYPAPEFDTDDHR